jgi:multimeric flavodoxin WrbA
MKVSGIIGSPKKNGNVDLLVSEVLKGANRQGAKTYKNLS